MIRILVGAMALLLLAACAGPAGQVPLREPAAEADFEPELEFEIGEPLGDDALASLYYHLLVAEFAASENDLQQALRAYLEAMRLHEDARIAERAARLALQLGADREGDQAVRRWLELAPDEPSAHLTAGLLLLRRGELEPALAHIRRGLDDPEGFDAAFTRLGVALTRLPDRDLALSVLERLAREYPAEPHAHYVRAQVAAHFGEFEAALTATRQALLLEPQWEAARLLMIRIHLQHGSTEEALELLEQVLKNRPDDYDLRLYYAQALLNVSQLELAMEQFELLLKHRPDDAQVLYGAALLALEMERYEAARAYLLRLVNVGERLDDAYYYLGRLAEVEDDGRGALRWYNEVGGERRVEAQLRMAMIAAAHGNMPAARQRLERLREQHPEEALRSLLVENDLLRRAGRKEEAHALLDQAIVQHPRAVELLYARALSHVDFDRIDAAEQDLRAVLALQPDHAHALNALGYTLVDRTERYEEGYRYILRAYELKPDSAAIIDSLGWAYYRMGDLEQALRYLEEAYELLPDPEIAAHLAEVRWHLGQREEAERVLGEALEQWPDAPVLAATRKRLRQ